MSFAYTVMWARDHCVSLQKAGEEGKPLQVLFGGEHQSAPSLKRAAISSGDVVFPVSVYKGDLYILAGVVIEKFVELCDYSIDELGLQREEVQGLHKYQIHELIKKRCENLGHREPYGCDTEVALARFSTPLRFDVTVPAQQLEEIRFCPRRGEPMFIKNMKAGKLTSAVSFHGNVRRLCGDAGTFFGDLVGLPRNA